MKNTTARALIDFIEAGPSCYHVIDTLRRELTAKGYEFLREEAGWELRPGGKYAVIRGDAVWDDGSRKPPDFQGGPGGGERLIFSAFWGMLIKMCPAPRTDTKPRKRGNCHEEYNCTGTGRFY